MIARTSDCRSRSSASSVSPFDVEQQEPDIGLLGQHRERLLAVMGKAKGEFLGADLAAEALPDQRFEINLVVDREDLGWAHRLLFTVRH